MKSTLWWLGLVFGTLSVLMLIKHGFDYGFVAPLQLVLDYYEQLIEALFGWAEPFVRDLLQRLEAWLGWDLELHAHWKYVFVLLWLYFGADARVDLQGREWGLLATSIFVGGAAALVSSVAFGALPKARLNADALPVLFPVAGMVMYEVVRSAINAHLPAGALRSGTRSKFYRGIVAFALPEAVLGLLVVLCAEPVLGMLVPGYGGNLSLLAFGSFMAVLAGYWVLRSAVRATFDRTSSEPWTSRFGRSGSQKIGFAMLQVSAASALFVVLDAGLSLAGIG